MFNHSNNSLDEFCNAMIDVQMLYFSPNAEPDAQPEQIELHFMFEDESEKTVYLTAQQLNAKSLEKVVPQLQIYRKKRRDFDDALREEVYRQYSYIMSEPSHPGKGILFTSPGIQSLPDRTHVYVWGDSILGNCTLPYMVLCNEEFLPHTEPVNDALSHLLTEITYTSPQALLGIAYMGVTLLRSWICGITQSWQAVLNIVGNQGIGKTTLAKYLTDWVKTADGSPALFFSAGSTTSAIRDVMLSAHDLPLVIDDLCLSASKNLERKYSDLGAQLVREGANAAPVVKKLPGGKSKKMKCCAGIILTAEFALENASDITRCIFIYLDKPLNLNSSLNSELVGAALKEFLLWFLKNNMQQDLQKYITTELQHVTDHGASRTENNFAILDSVFQFILFAATNASLSTDSRTNILAHYNKAKAASLQYQKKLLANLSHQKKKGNIEAIILQGYRKNAFNLTDKVKKLDKHDGIEWKRDLCLRRDALERFVRLQDGYQDYGIHKIVSELKKSGALVINEEGTAQVKLKKDTPRVYRIRLDVLKDCAEEY